MNQMAMLMEQKMAMGTTSVALVIDDDPHMRLWVKRVLSESFGRVLCASNVAEALAACNANSVTHVIVDNDLGDELTGLQLVLRLKAIRPGIERVVLCSGSQIDQATLPMFIDAYVRKGDDPSELLTALLE